MTHRYKIAFHALATAACVAIVGFSATACSPAKSSDGTLSDPIVVAGSDGAMYTITQVKPLPNGLIETINSQQVGATIAWQRDLYKCATRGYHNETVLMGADGMKTIQKAVLPEQKNDWARIVPGSAADIVGTEACKAVGTPLAGEFGRSAEDAIVFFNHGFDRNQNYGPESSFQALEDGSAGYQIWWKASDGTPHPIVKLEVQKVSDCVYDENFSISSDEHDLKSPLVAAYSVREDFTKASNIDLIAGSPNKIAVTNLDATCTSLGGRGCALSDLTPDGMRWKTLSNPNTKDRVSKAFDREISDWMRYLAKEEVPLSTMLEYCKIARAFLRFCREQNISWDAVNDDVLRSYRAMKVNCKIKVARINTLLGTIFQHYMWAERKGRIKDRVQRYELPQYSDQMQSHPFAFRSHEFKKKNGTNIRVTDTKMDGDGHRANRPTPTPSQMKLIHKAENGNRFEERNSLAYDMATDTSARCFETLQITVGQLPTREQLDRIYAGELTWSFTVTRKGNREGKLYPTAHLLTRALDFHDNERMDQVNWCRERGKPVSDRLFIGPMGKALTTSALSGIARLAFQIAGVRGSYHRLRAVRARREVERALNAVETGDIEVGPASLWKHSILMHAADILDHRSLASLEHYLNDLINSRIQTSAAYKLDIVDAAIREKELISTAFDRRIEKQRQIHATRAVVLDFSRSKTLTNPSAQDAKTLFDFETDIRNFRLSLGAIAG
jgi:hypothetical protein